MSRFVLMTRTEPRDFDRDGSPEIAVAADQIVAIEPMPHTGGGSAIVTLSGGRELSVQMDYQTLRDALMRRGDRLA